MRKLFLALSSVGLLTGCGHTGSGETGGYLYRDVPIEPVEKIIVNGPFKVFVMGDAGKTEVSLSGPANQMEDAVARVEEGALIIEFSNDAKWSWNPGAGTQASVMLPKLSSVAVNGAGRVEISGAKADKFQAGTSGSGKISIAGLEAGQVQFGTGGSGSIEARGTAESAQYGVGGSGSIEAKRLRVRTAQIGIAGSGSVYADVAESAKIGVAGSGRVEVVGGARCTFDEDQADHIECR